MPRFERVIEVDEPRDLIFDAATDVEKYPDFLSLWTRVTKTEVTDTHWRVEHRIGLNDRTVGFTMEGDVLPPDRVVMYSEDAPFKRIDAEIRFDAIGDDRTRLTFTADYSLRGGPLARLGPLMANRLTDKAVANFRARAHALGERRRAALAHASPAG